MAVGSDFVEIATEMTRDRKAIGLHVLHRGEDLVAIVAGEVRGGQEVSNGTTAAAVV